MTQLTPALENATGRRVWGMNRYQWLVLFAAWLGWGFDVFDALLFNYVSPNCVPTLLGLKIGSAEAKKQIPLWNGILTSVLLIGWATGGIFFGAVADRIGRTRTLLITILIYSVGTAACALAPNIWALMLFRFIVSLGIGGEWAAGASLVAETVPENRRTEAGALLYTSAPMGLFLATWINFQIAGHWLKGSPETSWRWVFLCGLAPAALAFAIRIFVKEPERWKSVQGSRARLSELFEPKNFALTRSGVLTAVTALITWWSCNAFISVVVSDLARTRAGETALDTAATLALVESWKATANNVFNLGGLIGTLLTVPLAKTVGRRPMLVTYFLASSASLFVAFGVPMAAHLRLYMYFPIGLSIFGVFGCFTYYLPELFPTRLRGTGSGFCYNIGRFAAAIGVFAVGKISSQGASAATTVLFWLGCVPLLGACLAPWIIETRGRKLAD